MAAKVEMLTERSVTELAKPGFLSVKRYQYFLAVRFERLSFFVPEFSAGPMRALLPLIKHPAGLAYFRQQPSGLSMLTSFKFLT